MSRKTKTAVADRVAKYRDRQRSAGMATLSVVVPAEDIQWFKALAAERRTLHRRKGDDPASGSHENGSAAKPCGPEPRTVEHSRAEAVANTILRRIVDRGWPEGEFLGTEAELMKTYRVSRTVLRQAISILQQLSVTQMRRGTHGGLVVTRPEPEATVKAVNVMLEYLGIQASDIYETRKLLESAAVTRTLQKLNADGRSKLETAVIANATLDGNSSVEDLQSFHVLLGELSGDPGLSLFIRIILKITDSHSFFSERPLADRHAVVERIKHYNHRIAMEIIAGNEQAALDQIEKYLGGLIDWMH